jgi:hypothetical protein
MLAIAGRIILLKCSCCWQDSFTKMWQLLDAYFTNAGNCWQDNFTKMQLLLAG